MNEPVTVRYDLAEVLKGIEGKIDKLSDKIDKQSEKIGTIEVKLTAVETELKGISFKENDQYKRKIELASEIITGLIDFCFAIELVLADSLD